MSYFDLHEVISHFEDEYDVVAEPFGNASSGEISQSLKINDSLCLIFKWIYHGGAVDRYSVKCWNTLKDEEIRTIVFWPSNSLVEAINQIQSAIDHQATYFSWSRSTDGADGMQHYHYSFCAVPHYHNKLVEFIMILKRNFEGRTLLKILDYNYINHTISWDVGSDGEHANEAERRAENEFHLFMRLQGY